MDTRPIGVFDSGLGGLTAAGELARLLPAEDIIYFGDTGRVPYGGKSRETILKYARQDVAFLRTFEIKCIVIACGTVSTTSLEALAQETPIPVIGVVEPACRAAAQATRSGSVGLIATKASIRSGAYERILAGISPDLRVVPEACPLLVPLVENGRIRPGDPVIETVVAEYLKVMKDAAVDTLMLGCTHYPLLGPIITAQMGPGVTLVDAGAQCARWVSELLRDRDQLTNPDKRTGEHRYFVSDTPLDFERIASLFLGHDITGQVEQVDIEKY